MGKNKKLKTTIYWAGIQPNNEAFDLNHLYVEPKSLYEECLEKKADLKDNPTAFFKCPAFVDFAKNLFVHRAPVDTHATLDFKKKRANYIFQTLFDETKFRVKLEFMREPTLEDHGLIQYSWPILFFSEEDSMPTTLTPPYFEQTTSSNYGVIVPGKFDIAKWFRPMNLEFQLWSGVNEIKISANEALCYVHFDTDKEITLKKFITNKEIDKIIVSLLKVSPFRRYSKLVDRYSVFQRSQSKERILNLIQKQLI